MSTREEQVVEEQDFVARVKTLPPGRLAVLRRNAGCDLEEARDVAWFYELLAGYGRWSHAARFMVATLIPLNPHSGTGDMGDTARVLAARAGGDGIQRRFTILLDADFGGWGSSRAGSELGFRLRQFTRLAASRDVGICWEQLLVDLFGWEGAPGYPKRVQRRWAEHFFTPPVAPTTSTENTTEKEQEGSSQC